MGNSFKDKIKDIADKVNKDKKDFEEKSLAEKAFREKFLKDSYIEEAKIYLPKYIDEEILKAAQGGKYSYNYVYEGGYPEILNFIMEEFKEFNPKKQSVLKYYETNYDLGQGYERYVDVISFSW